MTADRCPHGRRAKIEPCNECYEAYEAARDELIARNHAELDARRELHRQRTLATAMCELCDDNGRRPDGRICHHDVHQDDRTARGIAECSKALACLA
jgi:hypothetical protein